MGVQMPDGQDHPMASLAAGLGGGVRYPPNRSYASLKIFFALAPCVALVAVSIAWAEGAPFLLTFAGAFASIQLAQPYARWVRVLTSHLDQARRENRGAIDLALTKLEFANQPSLLVNLEAVGYSPVARIWARVRYAFLVGRWNRSFRDVSGRMVRQGGVATSPAAILRCDDPRKLQFDLVAFTKMGTSRKRRAVRFLAAFPFASIDAVANRLAKSSVVVRWRRYCADRVLKAVGVELVRAYAHGGADIPVVTLAKQLNLTYHTPQVKAGWVSE
ncbi:hypothetical protein BFL36_07500 [Clavibacter michiganensis]|uniref:Uncharacterized protein n=1 Tax=Clavibacter michiganensis TaxID=28447 RepID=A0A251YI35_9MICO|nr:hypothetical protein BFL36_07500 [Clavibacter michiganensis]